MVAGVVDALGNVVTLGGKGAVTGGIKAGVKGVAKAEVKNVAEDMAVGIIKSSADDILETGGKFIQKKPGQFGQFKGVDALKAENKVANDAAKAAKLTQDQARELHDQISGQGLTYQQILELAWAIKNGH